MALVQVARPEGRDGCRISFMNKMDKSSLLKIDCETASGFEHKFRKLAKVDFPDDKRACFEFESVLLPCFLTDNNSWALHHPSCLQN
jgi:hypothetical protein